MHTAENFELEVVFVLDFTNSLAQARLADGRTGIEALLGAFRESIVSLPGAHRVGVVEFHDRTFPPSVLVELTSDRELLLRRVDAFAASAFDPGSSRVWDAVGQASDLFSGRDGTVRAIVFISDGRDTSSAATRAQVVAQAKGKEIFLYPVGTGEIYEEDALSGMAVESHGAYYQVRELDQLGERLRQVTEDLTGQYKVSYNTLRAEGIYEVRVDVSLGGAGGSYISDPIDLATVFDADNVGQLILDPISYNEEAAQASVFLRALHMPRNVDEIRLRVDGTGEATAEIVAAADGGLLAGWALAGPDAEGWIEVSSPSPVAFGNFGLLLRLIVDGVAPGSPVEVEIDNSIYAGQKSLTVVAEEAGQGSGLGPSPTPTATPSPGDPTPSPTLTPSVFEGCSGLSALLDLFDVGQDLKFRALALLQVGIDSSCDVMIPSILAGEVITPTPTPTPTVVPSDVWVKSGDLQAARSKPVLADLGDGSVIAIGGKRSSGLASAFVDRYDPIEAAWAPYTSMIIGRESPTATRLNDGRVLVTGGLGVLATGVLASVEALEVINEAWISLGSMEFARVGHTATLLQDGSVLIVGGQLGTGAERTAEVFDPEFSTWTRVGDVAFPRHGHTATLMPDGTVLIIGSSSPGVQAVERFDPTTDQFELVGLLLATHSTHTATSTDASVLVLGGSPTSPRTAEVFSPTDGTSTVLQASDIADEAKAAFFTLDTSLLLIGPTTSELSASALASLASVSPVTVVVTPEDVEDAAWIQLTSGEILMVGHESSTQAWRFVF